MTSLKKKKKCFSLKVRFFLLVLLLSLVHQPDDRSKARLKSPRPKGESPPISKMPLQKGFRPFTHPFSSQPAACCESHPVGWWDVSSVRVRCGTALPTQSHGSNQAGRTVPWHWEPASKPTDLSVCLSVCLSSSLGAIQRNKSSMKDPWAPGVAPSASHVHALPASSDLKLHKFNLASESSGSFQC